MLGALLPAVAQLEGERKRRNYAQNRIHDQQALEVPVAPERGAEQEREQNPDEAPRRADGDAGRALLGGQVLACDLADRAEHDRLSDGHRDLTGHRPRERVAAQADQPPERDERPPPASIGRNQRSSRIPAGMASTT